MAAAAQAAVAATPSKARPLLRCLMLHGYLQNASSFRRRCHALRKALASVATLEFAEAPFDAPVPETGEVVEASEDGGRRLTWWRFQERGERVEYHGWREALAQLDSFIKEKGPFDGLIGFSQGAAMAAMACALEARRRSAGPSPAAAPPFWSSPLQFAIIVGGFLPRDPEPAALFAQTVALPTLHVWGEGDQKVVPARSVALAERFVDPVRVVHTGGHFIPASAPQRAQYLDFLSRFKPLGAAPE